MTYVPTPVHVHVTSRQTRELADKLTQVVVDFEKEHPTITSGEIREATRIAARATSSGRDLTPVAVTAALGLAALVLALALVGAETGALRPVTARYAVIGVIAFIGIGAAVVSVLRRSGR